MLKNIIRYEVTGFMLIIVLQWGIEIFDFPSFLSGQEPTPVNFSESFIETVFILLAAYFTVSASAKLVTRIKFLEGFIAICSSCKKIRIDSEWVSIEEYIHKNSELQLTHSICPDCAEKLYDINPEVK